MFLSNYLFIVQHNRYRIQIKLFLNHLLLDSKYVYNISTYTTVGNSSKINRDSIIVQGVVDKKLYNNLIYFLIHTISLRKYYVDIPRADLF